jgi:hypothetical protein
MSKTNWKYEFFLKKQVNEDLSNCIARQKQRSTDYKQEIQKRLKQNKWE